MNCANQSLKIIIAVHHFPPSYKGGAEWRAHRTATWLQKQGHTVKVICVESISDSGTTDLRWIDEEFDSLPVRRLFLNLSNAPDQAQWEYDNPWIGAHLSQYLAEEKPDIFHLISGYLMSAAAIKAAKSLAIPVALTLTDFWFLCPRHTLQRTSGQICAKNRSLDCVRCSLEEKRRFRLPAQKATALTDALWHRAQALPVISERVAKMDSRVEALRAALSEVEVAICPSNFLKQTYLDRGFKARRMQFLRQGLAHVPPLPLKKSPSSQLRVGYIGQVAPHKGVHILIEAFLKLVLNLSKRSNYALDKAVGPAQSAIPTLKLYGDTTQFPNFYRDLQDRLDKSSLNGRNNKHIQFMGTFDNRQINRIYEAIDVLVVPSIWYENSPNTILEAFAHQTPVIASNLGGMAELVTDQKIGLLFAPNNANDLAQKLRTVLDNPEILPNLQKNIDPPVTLEAEMTELLQIYQSILLPEDNNA